MSDDSAARRGSKASGSIKSSAVSGGKGRVPSRSPPSSGSIRPLYQSLDSPLDVRGLPLLLTALLDVVQQCRIKYPFDSTIGDAVLRYALDKGRLSTGLDFEKCVLAVSCIPTRDPFARTPRLAWGDLSLSPPLPTDPFF